MMAMIPGSQEDRPHQHPGCLPVLVHSSGKGVEVLSLLPVAEGVNFSLLPLDLAYGSLIFTGDNGNPHATFSYKSGGSSQRSRRRFCTIVSGDNRACNFPLTSITLTLIVFMARSSSSALGRAVLRPGCPA